MLKKLSIFLLLFISINSLGNRYDNEDVIGLLGLDASSVDTLDIRACKESDIIIKELCELAMIDLGDIDGWIVSFDKNAIYAQSNFHGNKRLKENYYLKELDIYLKLSAGVSTLDPLKIEDQFFPDIVKLNLSGYASGDGDIEYRKRVIAMIKNNYDIDVSGSFEAEIIVAFALNPNLYYDWFNNEYIATYQPVLRIMPRTLDSDIDFDVDSKSFLVGSIAASALDLVGAIKNALIGNDEEAVANFITYFLNLTITLDDLLDDEIFETVSDLVEILYDDRVESVFESIEDTENKTILDLLGADSNGIVQFRYSAGAVKGKAYAKILPAIHLAMGM